MHRGVTVLVLCRCLCLSATKDVTTSTQEYYAQVLYLIIEQISMSIKNTNDIMNSFGHFEMYLKGKWR